MSRIKGTGEGIKFLISAFNMVKRGEVKNLDQLMQFAKQQFGDLDSGFMDQIKDAFKKGQSSAITEKRTKDIAKGDVVEEEGLSSLMKSLEEKAGNLKKTLDESKKSSSTMLEDALDAATGFKRSTGSKDKAKPFRTPGMPYQRENPDYRLPGGSMYAEGNLRTAIRQFLRSEIEAGNLKVNDTDAFRVKEYSPMSEDDPIDVFRRYYGEDALQAADDMADALKEGINNTNIANSSSLPKIIPILKAHLDGLDNEEKFPLGPIISPNPGPTFEIEVAAPQIEVTKSQADILLWCVEQMFIDLSDAEERDLEPVLNTLAEIVR